MKTEIDNYERILDCTHEPASQRQNQFVLRGARRAAFANRLFVQQHFQRGLESEPGVLDEDDSANE
jgi:hypothetical protein